VPSIGGRDFRRALQPGWSDPLAARPRARTTRKGGAPFRARPPSAVTPSRALLRLLAGASSTAAAAGAAGAAFAAVARLDRGARAPARGVLAL